MESKTQEKINKNTKKSSNSKLRVESKTSGGIKENN